MKNDWLDKIGHIEEIYRTLRSFLFSNKQGLSEKEIIALANQTAGEINRYPRPRPALQLAEDLGLIKKYRQIYDLTSLGLDYITQKSLTKQCEFLFGLLAENKEIGVQIKNLLTYAQSNHTVQISQNLLTTQESRNTAKLLQQLGVLEYKDGWFILVQNFENVTLDLLLHSRASLKEEDLWKRLDAQRLRAKFIEEKVVIAERSRLTSEGRKDLADTVTRISALDAGAGYDVASFEVTGETRYIEVKSSIGRKVKFEWSESERIMAEKTGSLYWVYFVPFAHMVEEKVTCLVRIKDPIKKLKQKNLLAKPSTWEVSIAGKSADKVHQRIYRKERFDW